MQILYLVFFGSAVWVGIDASNLGMSRGRLGGGLLDMGVAAWVIVVALFWIIGFPCYLVARFRYVALTPAATWAPQPAQAMAPAPAPPQFSADQMWWWNGHQWTPTAQNPASRP